MTSPTDRCRLCGAALEEPPEVARRVCPNCGEVNWVSTGQPSGPGPDSGSSPRWRGHLVGLGVALVVAAAVARSDLRGSPNGMLHGLFAFFALIFFLAYAAVTTVAVAAFTRTIKGVALVHGAIVGVPLILVVSLSVASLLQRKIEHASQFLAVPPIAAPPPVAPPPPTPARAPSAAERSFARLSDRVAAELSAGRWTIEKSGCIACSLEAVVGALAADDAHDCGSGDPVCALEKAAQPGPFKAWIPLRGMDSQVTDVFLRTKDGTLVKIGWDSAAGGFLARCTQTISIFACESLRPDEAGNPECIHPKQAGRCRDSVVR